MKVARNKISAALSVVLVCAAFSGCNKAAMENEENESGKNNLVSLEEVAKMLASVPLGEDRIGEVLDAVTSSKENGYDEEYMIADLLVSPGKGVDEERVKGVEASRKRYDRPLKAVFEEFCSKKASASTSSGGDGVKSGVAPGNGYGVKSGDGSGTTVSAEEYLRYLRESDMQIYWPDSETWDKSASPVVTFAPDDESAVTNIGYFLNEKGEVEEIEVDEKMSQTRPVWVVNRNDDSSFTSLEIMKKNDPDWESGGNIVIQASGTRGKTASKQSKLLTLKSFKMLRHYDSWLRGASEFFVKIGALNSFTASTEAELKLYNPEVTDFMVVVRRKELGVEKNLGAILVSDWTDQLEDCAFMIIEDDGGSITSWKCSGTVKINSKSYGFDVSLPLRSYDDIVWRGKLSKKYLDSAPTVTGRFGDTEITFATENY